MARTDRLNADLERGFLALEAGRIEDASAIVERCRRIDRKNPDVLALGAGVADARGEVDDALELYTALEAARPDDPMPKICIARLMLHDKAEPAAALANLEAAFPLIEEDADLVEAVMVKTEALLATGNLAAARDALGELASSVLDDRELALDLAELALSAEDPAAAERWIESVRRDAPPALEADALHMLGRVYEARDDRAKMIEAWRKVRAIDATLPPGPVEVSDDELERIASETLAELPDNVRAHLERVPILIDDLPSEGLIDDGLDPRLLGLFQGSPLPEGGGLAPTVTNILLFRKNLERSASDVDHLADEIRITVLHETAHYFGLDEEDLEAIGLD